MGDEQLIDLVRQYEVIYNTKSKKYRDVNLRSIAWEEISMQLGETVDQCKEAWNKLRNCYNNAIRRRRKRCGQLGKKLAPWRFEKQMSFVKPHLGGHHAKNNHDDMPEDVSDSIPSPESIKRPESPRSVLSCTSKRSRASPGRDNLGVTVDMMRNPLEMREKEQEIDDLDHFFLSMSKMVKKLPKLDQIRIKLDLHQSITRAEIKQLQAQQNIK